MMPAPVADDQAAEEVIRGTHSALGAVLALLIEERLHGLEGLDVEQRWVGAGCQPSRQGTWPR